MNSKLGSTLLRVYLGGGVLRECLGYMKGKNFKATKVNIIL
jgi:hypothetical protein